MYDIMEMFDKNQYFRGTPLNYILGDPSNITPWERHIEVSSCLRARESSRISEVLLRELLPKVPITTPL